jgi:hypothetical protein
LNEGDSVVSVNKIINPDEDDVTIQGSSSETPAPESEVQQTSLLASDTEITEE